MFALAIVVLGVFALLLHVHVLPQGASWVRWCLVALGFLYPVFWFETAAHLAVGSPRMRQNAWFCLLPFVRVGARDHQTGQNIWLPVAGWREVNRTLEKKLIKVFSIPMIAVALLVLPIVIMEFGWAEFVESSEGWQTALQIAAAFIWAAFTFEFTLIISVVKYRSSYALRHWIDVLIILLPMVTFIRAARLTQLMRMKQLTRTVRLYRLRGLAMKLWRALVALEVVEMLLSLNPERRLEKLEARMEEKLEEIEFLKQDIVRLQRRIAKREAGQEQQQSADENASACDESGVPRAAAEVPPPAAIPATRDES